MSLLTPTDEREVAEAVAAAAAAGTPLEISGGGTRAALGRPVQAERTLSTSALAGITLYEPGALTLVVKAGTPVVEVEQALHAEGQILPFEPMDHRSVLGTQGTPTIGGAVAVAAAGPRRIQRGACRDAMIGLRLVDGSGTVVRNGGRVMKNVTGYDLVKLMAGAYGTLGVLTEIAFKLVPASRRTCTLTVHGLTPDRAVLAMADAFASPHDVSGAAHLPAGPDGDARTMIRIEGLDASVAYRAEALERILSAHGSVASAHAEGADDGWRAVRDVERFAGRDGAVWRVSVAPTDGPGIVATLADAGVLKDSFYDWGGGLVWVLVAADGDASAAILRRAVAGRGHATLVRAPAALRAAVDVFEPEPAPLTRFSQGLRARFDPKGILNPGRMRA